MDIPFDIVSFLIGGLGGATVGSLITLQVKKNMSSSGAGNTVDQSGATAVGDMVGRDKNTK